jgi:hypothetical protein
LLGRTVIKNKGPRTKGCILFKHSTDILGGLAYFDRFSLLSRPDYPLVRARFLESTANPVGREESGWSDEASGAGQAGLSFASQTSIHRLVLPRAGNGEVIVASQRLRWVAPTYKWLTSARVRCISGLFLTTRKWPQDGSVVTTGT